MKTERINLLSSPRNLSTALMYSFAQRNDTQVIDEPFYGHYLRHVEVHHPGIDDVLASLTDEAEVIAEKLCNGKLTKKVLFIKNMTAHMTAFDTRFLGQLTNIIYIRDPKLILHSYAKVAERPTARELGTALQFELFQQLSAKNKRPIVLDSSELLKNPAKVLQQLCKACAIPWMESMLSWEAGPRPEDGVWAKYWYNNVHKSTGFKPFKKTQIQLPPSLQAIYQQLKPYYESLYQYAIKA